MTSHVAHLARVVSLWCPEWPVTTAAVGAGEPVVVLRAGRVIARSARAAADGVVAGLRRREAHGRCPAATMLVEDTDWDARMFEPVVRAIAAFTPLVEVVEPGWAQVAARGPARYFGGEAALARRLTDAAVAAGGIDARVGIGDGRFTAAVAARLATTEQPCLVPAGSARGFLAPLPISWLHLVGELDADTVDVFSRLGLGRLGDLAALPAADVAARFGPAGLLAHRFASGDDTRGATGTPPPAAWTVEHACERPIDDALTAVFLARPLAEQLIERVAATGAIVVRVTVSIATDHGEQSVRAWYRSAGLSPAAIVERVRWQLGAWIDTDDLTAGITMLRLAVDETRADRGEQIGLWGGRSAADETAIRAVDRLSALLGEKAVTVAEWHGGHLPGDRYRWIPATSADLADTTATAARLAPAAGEGRWPGAVPPPSPIELRQPAVRVEVDDETGAAVFVNGRGELSAAPATIALTPGRGAQAVRSWAGPWTMDTAWWRPEGRRRTARLQVVTDDGTAVLLIAERQCWWLYATYF